MQLCECLLITVFDTDIQGEIYFLPRTTEF